jgi:hypothetical protein
MMLSRNQARKRARRAGKAYHSWLERTWALRDAAIPLITPLLLPLYRYLTRRSEMRFNKATDIYHNTKPRET